jgi:predicted O-methyltransferase YrrM
VHLERGDALGILAAAPTDSEDLIFIDGAKIEYPEYFAEALRICRVGGLIIADNTLYGGQVSLPAKDDPRTRAIRRYNALAFSRQDVMSTVLPIGDGFTVSLRLA